MNLAEKLTIQRKKSGMSQEQLAERLGITRQSVSKWEAGSSIPEISKLVAMSEIFRVSLDYLLKDYLDEEKNSGIAAGGCRNEPYGEKRSEANQQMDEDNSRLEKKVDDLARYIKGYQYTSKTKIAGDPAGIHPFFQTIGQRRYCQGNYCDRECRDRRDQPGRLFVWYYQFWFDRGRIIGDRCACFRACRMGSGGNRSRCVRCVSDGDL